MCSSMPGFAAALPRFFAWRKSEAVNEPLIIISSTSD